MGGGLATGGLAGVGVGVGTGMGVSTGVGAGAGLGLARVWVGAIEVTAATAAAGGGDPAGSVKNLRLNGPRNLSGFAPPICIFYATVQRRL